MYLFDLSISVATVSPDIRKAVADLLDIPGEMITDLFVLKKSLDARNKRNILWHYSIAFNIDKSLPDETIQCLQKLRKFEFPAVSFPKARRKKKVVIVGMGPAGIFAALVLARAGISPLILERGKKIEERVKDVNSFFINGILNTGSNVQFGEGGAGTFSDGKLTARTRHPYYQFFTEELIKAGAPEDIRYLAKPHIGTDRLRAVIINLRKELLNLGSEICFGEKLEHLLLDSDRRVIGTRTDLREIRAEALILATGYSARDTMRNMLDDGVAMEPKGFAMGYRMELLQNAINEMQYGKYGQGLPPAEFFLKKHFPEKGISVYTFCMCPGGLVIPAVSENRALVLNGMSDHDRSGRFGNAAVVVSHDPALWGATVDGGFTMQENVETAAYNAGGDDYRAPALTVADFVTKKTGMALPETSYPRGVVQYPIWEFFPDFYEYFKSAFLEFDRRMNGIVSDRTLLLAPETRTSSPLRIVRGEDMISINTPNLFPCGEGAGYAGGIVTSAIDGIRAAVKILEAG